jgi:hypothetical protein
MSSRVEVIWPIMFNSKVLSGYRVPALSRKTRVINKPGFFFWGTRYPVTVSRLAVQFEAAIALSCPGVEKPRMGSRIYGEGCFHVAVCAGQIVAGH